MTLARWLAHRSPPPPEALGARIVQLILEAEPREDSPAAERLVEAAGGVLARLLREGCATRQSALDLLAADAMATYAFEAAAEEPERMVERTDRAMIGIAALAATQAPADARPAARDSCR